MSITRNQMWALYVLTAGLTDSSEDSGESLSQFRMDFVALSNKNHAPTFTAAFISVANVSFGLSLTPQDFVDKYGTLKSLSTLDAGAIRTFLGLDQFYPPPSGPCMGTGVGQDVFSHVGAAPDIRPGNMDEAVHLRVVPMPRHRYDEAVKSE
jgi:hypothetical protein